MKTEDECPEVKQRKQAAQHHLRGYPSGVVVVQDRGREVRMCTKTGMLLGLGDSTLSFDPLRL